MTNARHCVIINTMIEKRNGKAGFEVEKHYTKTYGIKQGFEKGKQRWFVMCEGTETRLHFARPEKALETAERFVKSLYAGAGTSWQGDKQIFYFEKIDY